MQPIPQRPTEQSLLVEYEMCERQAERTANWVWVSTSVFLVAWITGLGLAAWNWLNAKVEGATVAIAWVSALFALVAQVLWWVFMARSFHVRQLLFLRQRQIEEQLGLIRGHAITVADALGGLGDSLDKLAQFGWRQLYDYQERIAEVQAPLFEQQCVEPIAKALEEECKLGRGGRSTLYALSILVIFGWLALALLTTVRWFVDKP